MQGKHLLASPGVDDAVVEHARLLQDRSLLDAVEGRVLDLCTASPQLSPHHPTGQNIMRLEAQGTADVVAAAGKQGSSSG